MATTKTALEILTDAERRLREVVANAAAAGEYDAVQRIAEWARTVGALARAHASAESIEPVTMAMPPAIDERDVNGSTCEPVDVASMSGNSAPVRRSKRVPSKGEYPKFFRRGEQLVKIGWSKKEREEYEHKAPRRVVDALTAAIARHSGNGKLFTAEDLFPLKDAQEGAEIPGYQAYVALAWLKSAGLVKQHGRRGYTVRNGIHLADALVASWQKLPDHVAPENVLPALPDGQHGRHAAVEG